MNGLRRRRVIDDITYRIKKVKLLKIILSSLFTMYIYLRYKNLAKKNILFKNIHQGETCYVLGSGISLDILDITELKNKKTFACNDIFLHEKFNNLNLDYYVTIEPFFGGFLGKKYVEDTFSLYNGIAQAFVDKDTKLFFHPTVKKILNKYKYLNNKSVYFVPSSTDFLKMEKPSNNIAGKFNFGAGGLSFMIATAIYMGFQKIVLLGCGYTYNPRQEYHFYARPEYLKSKINYADFLIEVDRFAKKNDFIVMDIEDTQDKYLPIFASPWKNDSTEKRYELLRKFSDEHNVEIINVHPEGYKSPCFIGLTSSQYQHDKFQNNN